MRIRLDLAYDGTDFHGWAAQPQLRTVQGELEAALGTVLRTPDVALVCAGRTDTGVHARGQVAHLDVEESLVEAAAGRSTLPPLDALLRRLNGLLPGDVRVHGVAEAPAGFDARFSALWRRYAYRIADAAGAADPLLRRHVVEWPRPLDVAAMNAGAAALLGEHDFAAFCKHREGATTIRKVLELRWDRDGVGLATATVRADAFCHHMVRSLMGCLVAIGEGRRTPSWAGEILAAAVRDPAVANLPAHGLTLEEVGYPADADLAARAEESRKVRTL
ncbi:MAG: tRNA pseudouridine(38-40) synthase TruA [Nocardioidaceae bacterium]